MELNGKSADGPFHVCGELLHPPLSSYRLEIMSLEGSFYQNSNLTSKTLLRVILCRVVAKLKVLGLGKAKCQSSRS